MRNFKLFFLLTNLIFCYVGIFAQEAKSVYEINEIPLNLFPDSSFESGGLYIWNRGERVAENAKSGSYCWKAESSGKPINMHYFIYNWIPSTEYTVRLFVKGENVKFKDGDWFQYQIRTWGPDGSQTTFSKVKLFNFGPTWDYTKFEHKFISPSNTDPSISRISISFGLMLATNNTVEDLGYVWIDDMALICHAEEKPTVPYPGIILNPFPMDKSEGVDVYQELSWTSGEYADGHNVYFGTSDPPAFKGLQNSTIYNPGVMSDSLIHYWYAEGVNSTGRTPSPLLWFRTKKVEEVSSALLTFPANEATDVPLNTPLVWTNGENADSCILYLSTSNPPVQIASRMHVSEESEFIPTLSDGTTYYWKILSKNSKGEVESPVWSFTTEQGLSTSAFWSKQIQISRIYPSLVKDNATFMYKIQAPDNISVDIYDISGQKVCNLINQFHSVGEYSLEFNIKEKIGKMQKGGFYIVKLTSSNGSETSRFSVY